ncbi:Serine protease [Phytophthora megakarya]|uniref:Serine protease n=1 Tax=Phytophthora megakarya TaxID=4795 RepID=A0A225VVN4_9STRA|nr:Serine protease [Phytophthora megakarya]
MGNVFTCVLGMTPQHQQRRLRLVFVLLLLYLGKKLLGPTLTAMLLRWHFAHTAETPRLIYKTPANTKLLSHCVTMTQTKYYPPWNLFNGHLQTIKFASDERGPQINYKRQLLNMPDGGVVSLDWALLPTRQQNVASTATDSWIEGVDPTKRTVLLLPGLTGGSPANYIRFTVAKLHEIGWQCVVLNARGCARTPLRTAQLYCTAYTEDLRYVLQQLAKKYDFKQEAFVGVGFSMGSNVLVKYLGEEGVQTPLTGAVSVGNPFNLTKVSENLSGTMFNRLMYDKALNRSMRSLFFEKSNAAEKFKGYPGLDLEAVRASRTVREFDDTLTSVLFNYKNADHFYEDASSDKKLRAVKIPLLCINAEDDPISVCTALPSRALVESCPSVILCVTKSGGHLAYYESSFHDEENGTTKKMPSMWSAKPIAEFAEAVRLCKVEAAQ